MKLIPLYFGGNLIGHYDEVDLLDMKGIELVYNRRGHLKRAYLTQLQSVVDISHGRDGMCKVQTLTCGRIYALIGVRGSGNV